MTFCLILYLNLSLLICYHFIHRIPDNRGCVYHGGDTDGNDRDLQALLCQRIPVVSDPAAGSNAGVRKLDGPT